MNPKVLLSLSVGPLTASTPVNGTQQFAAIATWSDQTSSDVTTAVVGTGTLGTSWTATDLSGGPNVATLSANGATGGLATGKVVGTSTITASYTINGITKANSATLTVIAATGGVCTGACPAPILGTASTYGIIASDAMTSSSALAHIYGDVALTDPTSTSTSVTGSGFMDSGALPALFSSGVTNSTGVSPGIINTTNNGGLSVAQLAQLQADLETAYNDNKLGSPTRVAPLAAPTPTGNGGTFVAGVVDLSGMVLRPGIYAVGTSTNTYGLSNAFGPLVLDAQGNADAVFVFQADTMTTTTGSVILQNGAQAKNVYWVLTNDATIGTNTFFQGTLVAGKTITVNAGASVQGRMLAGGDVAAPGGTGNITVSGVITVPQ